MTCAFNKASTALRQLETESLNLILLLSAIDDGLIILRHLKAL